MGNDPSLVGVHVWTGKSGRLADIARATVLDEINRHITSPETQRRLTEEMNRRTHGALAVNGEQQS